VTGVQTCALPISAVIIGIADVSFTFGDYSFNGIINATLVAVIGFRVLHSIAKSRGTATH
jgi:NCS2 family nucleobase:cation symporter-2